MKFVLVKNAQAGDIIFHPARNEEGEKILKRGTILSPYFIELLKMNNIRGITVCTTKQEANAVCCTDIIETRLSRSIDSLSHRFVSKVLESALVKQLFNGMSDHVKEHSLNVAIYTTMLLNYNMCNIVGQGKDIITGAILHDIGKDKIPGEIMYAPRKLSETEFDVVKLHTLSGHSILTQNGFNSTVSDIALMHHETFDGTGYPNNKKGSEIPWYVDLVHICDVYDALCSKRIYKPSRLREDARDVIAKQRNKYNPSTYDAFMDCMPSYFLGDLLSVYNSIYEVIGYSDDRTPILRQIVTQEDILLSEVKGKIETVDKLGGIVI